MILFPIDARGLVACPGGACPPEVNLAIAGMEEAAELTGGGLFTTTMDLPRSRDPRWTTGVTPDIHANNHKEVGRSTRCSSRLRARARNYATGQGMSQIDPNASARKRGKKAFSDHSQEQPLPF